MAEAVVNVVAEGVLKKALQLASEELSLLWGFKDDLQKLAETLEIIHDLVADADGKRISLMSVSRWLKNLNILALEAGAVLDEYGYHILYQQVSGSQKFKLNKVRGLFTSSNPLLVRHMLSRKIKQVNSMFDALYKRANDIGLRPVELLHTSVQIREIRKSDPSMDESNFVGRDGDIKMIVKMLEQSLSKELEVIGIVGMGGQGKTTLAQAVYKHEKVVRLFNHRMWICVSDDFDVDRLLKEMMQCLNLDSSQDLSNREVVIKKIKEKLKGEKYLLILDDVWNDKPHVWEVMRNCLTNVSNTIGNKVLVTTRKKDVVSTMQPSRHHSLGGLSDEHSLKLFKNIAFAEGGPEKTNNLEDISDKMVKKCKNLPLAIKTLASLMWTIKVENEWSKMEENIRWSSQSDEDIVLSTIRLSYDHLSSLSLKQCFAYCSIFKKDTILEKENLLQLWSAQGLLNPVQESTHVAAHSEYLIGDNYFNVLMQNNFFINLEKDKYDNVVSCMMHDIVHDLSLKISKEYCSTLLSEKENCSSEAMHLTSDGKLISQIPIMIFSKLRTLYLVGNVGPAAPDFLVNLTSLRALILEDEDCSRLPQFIGKLKHLRYLDISKTLIRTLPNSICKLFYLETLRLNFLNKLPPKFENLVSLRYFYIRCQVNMDVKFPLPNVGQFTHIQTLPYFVVCSKIGCEINQLGELTCLKGKLRIYGLEHITDKKEAEGAKLSNKSHVYSLELIWNNQHSNVEAAISSKDVCNDHTDVLEGLEPHPNLNRLEVLNFQGTHLSSWMLQRSSSILENLLEIKLQNFDNCQNVPPLGCLPKLKIVCLSGLRSIKRIGNDFYGLTDATMAVFPMLIEIIIENMMSLVKWENANPSSSSEIKLFSKLEKFNIQGCPKLTFLPGMKNLKHLQEFKILDCSRLEHLPTGLGSCVSLKTMTIWKCEKLTCSPIMENLEHIQEFKIGHCLALEYLPIELGVSLKKLRIEKCEKLFSLPNMKNLKCLQEFKLGYCSALEHFSIGLESCISLEMMKIWECKKLTCSLNIENLENLQEFKIHDCLSLERLSIGSGAFLKKLEIRKCEKVACLLDVKNLKHLQEFKIGECSTLEHLTFGLENLENLQEFEIHNCLSLERLPIGLGVSLKKLVIENCKMLACLPNVKNLKHLQEFKIINCFALEHLPIGLGSCVSLKTMEIYGCNKLTYSSDMENLEHLQEFKILYCLSLERLPIRLGVSLKRLIIKECKKLASLPNMKNLKHLQEFKIYGCSALEHLPIGLESCVSLKMMELRNCKKVTCSLDMENLEHLQELSIYECPALERLPIGVGVSLKKLKIRFCEKLASLPDMKNLKHLQKFTIVDCSILKDLEKWNGLLNGIKNLASLQKLRIGISSELDSFSWPGPEVAPGNNGEAQQPFPSLTSLILCGSEKLIQLPKQLMKLPALKSLELWKFDGLKDLPKRLSNIQTLRGLDIRYCKKLKQLPHLPNLMKLIIIGCPLLIEKYAQRSGPEWDNIDRIPFYVIDGYTQAGKYQEIYSWRPQRPSDKTGQSNSKGFPKMFSKVSKKISNKICI